MGFTIGLGFGFVWLGVDLGSEHCYPGFSLDLVHCFDELLFGF